MLWLWTLVLAAPAQSLDHAALEAARQADVSPAYQDLARKKRTESITRLEELLGREVAAATRAEMCQRLADLYLMDFRGGAGPERLEQAAALYGAILEDHPAHPRADQVLLYLALAEVGLDRGDDARQHLGELLEHHGDSALVPDAHLQLGDLRWPEPGAHAAYRHAAGYPEHREHAYATYRLGWVHHALGEAVAAQTAWQTAAASDDPHVAAAARADLLAELGVALEPPPAAATASANPQTPPSPCAVPQAAADTPRAWFEVVQCWHGAGDLAAAQRALASLEDGYSPRSAWAEGRSRAEIKAAREWGRRAEDLLK